MPRAGRRAFSTPSQHERWRRLLERRWNYAFFLGAVIVSVISQWLWSPDTANDFNRFGHRRLSLRHRREGEANLAELRGVPSVTKFHDDPTIRKIVEVRR